LINVVKNLTLNVYEKNCDNVFLIFFNYHCNDISGALYLFFMLFDPTNKIVLTSIEKNLNKLETENVRKQLKTSLNVNKKC